MRVDNFQFQIYGDDNFDRLLNPRKALNGLSMFMLLNKCLEKADKSGDGIVSKHELNIFKMKNSADILKEVQKDIPSYELDVDDEALLGLMDTVKGLIAKNDKISEDTDSFKGMTKEEFIKTAEEKALENNNEDESLTSESETESTETEETDILENGEDDENTKESEDTTTEENDANTLWRLIYADGAEDVFDKMDKDGDGILSEAEVAEISKGDDNGENISMTDLSKIFSFGYYDDIGTSDNSINSDVASDNSHQPQDSSADNSSSNAKTDYSSSDYSGSDYSSSGSSSVSSGGGGGSSSNSDSGSDAGANSPTPDTKGKTAQEIETEIQQQEQNKTTTTEKAKSDIQAKQALIDDLVSKSDLSDAFKKEYESENTRIQGLIDENDSAYNAQQKLVQDSTAKISSYTTAIGDIDKQIESLSSQKGKLDQTQNADTIKDYDTKIENLKTKKAELQQKLDTENANLEQANTTLSELESKKTELANEKNNVLSKLSEKYGSEASKVENLKTQIESYKTEINNLKSTLDKNLAEINGNIQTLKNEKASVEQKEQTDKILAENSVLPDNAPYLITSDPQTFDWASIGYNAETGKQLADGVYKYANGRTGNHQCLGGVKKGFNNAFDTNPFKDIGAGYQAAGVLEKDKNFREVTGLSIEQLKYLPAGTVISWSNSPGGSSPASKYGHCSISLGNGYEASDHICKQYRHVGESGTPRVFIPIADQSQYKQY